MEDKVIRTEEELSIMHLNMVDGQRVPIHAKTIYTHYESGRKDCTIQLEHPIDLNAKAEKPKGIK